MFKIKTKNILEEEAKETYVTAEEVNMKVREVNRIKRTKTDKRQYVYPYGYLESKVDVIRAGVPFFRRCIKKKKTKL